MWTLGIMGLLLTGVYVFVVRFSLKMIDEQTKTATAGATVQMRNEYGRALAKEVQKLWDSNSADVKKLKETLTAQFAELEQNLKDRSDFQMQFLQALTEGLDERQGDSLLTFRNALRTCKSGKPRNLIEAKVGATTARSIFESPEESTGKPWTAREVGRFALQRPRRRHSRTQTLAHALINGEFRLPEPQRAGAEGPAAVLRPVPEPDPFDEESLTLPPAKHLTSDVCPHATSTTALCCFHDPAARQFPRGDANLYFRIF
jgi:hypothetical protein